MKKATQCAGVWAVCLFLMTGACIQGQAQTNLVENPDFELWTDGLPDGWLFAEQANMETEHVFEGSYAVKQRVRVTQIWQEVTGIQAGNTYTISYHYYDNDPDAKSRIWSYWLEGETLLEDHGEILRPDGFSSDADAWQAFSETLVAPPGADGLRLEVRTYDEGQGGGAVYYDHFAVLGEPPVVDGGHETFDNFEYTGTNYASGTFLGQDGSDWTYVECRGDFDINGKAITLGPNRTPQSNVYSGLLEGGIGVLSFDYMQAFSSDVNLRVLVNDQEVAVVTTNDQQGVVLHSGDIPVHTPEAAVIKFIGVTNSAGQVTIDNVIWSFYDESVVPEVVEVASVSELRTKDPGEFTHYRIPGEVIVTWSQPAAGKFYIQDETAAIVLWDADGLLSESYDLYDGISGIEGYLVETDGMLYWVPVGDPGAASSSNNTVSPQAVSLSQLSADPGAYQVQLVEVEAVSFTDASGTFQAGEWLEISDDTGVFGFYTLFADADYIGNPVPDEAVIIRGLVGANAAGYFVTARNSGDIQDETSPSAFSVVFTVIDDSESLKRVDLAGDMTEWDFVSMLEDPAFNWSVTLNLPPGSYAWNAAGDNGADPPFWLIPESHLNVNVTEDGSTTGDISYVYMVTATGDASVRLSVVKMYPNPAGTYLHVDAETTITALQVQNVLGEEVYSNNNVASRHYELNVGQFPPGFYVVTVVTDDGVAADKVRFGK